MPLLILLSVGMCGVEAMVEGEASPKKDEATQELYNVLLQASVPDFPGALSCEELLETMGELIKKVARLEQRPALGNQTPLHFAASIPTEKDARAVAEYLVSENKELINLPDEKGIYPANEAAKQGHIDLAVELTRTADQVLTIAVQSAQMGHDEFIGELMKDNLLKGWKNSNTVAKAAVKMGRLEVIEAMRAKGYNLHLLDLQSLRRIQSLAEEKNYDIRSWTIPYVIRSAKSSQARASYYFGGKQVRKKGVGEAPKRTERQVEQVREPAIPPVQVVAGAPLRPQPDRPRFTRNQRLAIGGTAVGAATLLAAYLIYRKFRKKTLTEEEMDEWIRHLHELRTTDWEEYERELERLNKTVNLKQAREIFGVFEGMGGRRPNPRLVDLVGPPPYSIAQ